MPFVQHDPRRLVWQQNDRYLWIEPWGENSLRVRSGRHLPVMRNEDWAFNDPVAELLWIFVYVKIVGSVL